MKESFFAGRHVKWIVSALLLLLPVALMLMVFTALKLCVATDEAIYICALCLTAYIILFMMFRKKNLYILPISFLLTFTPSLFFDFSDAEKYTPFDPSLYKMLTPVSFFLRFTLAATALAGVLILLKLLFNAIDKKYLLKRALAGPSDAAEPEAETAAAETGPDTGEEQASEPHEAKTPVTVGNKNKK